MHISYPINASYATTILNLHKPWRTKYQVCPQNIEEYSLFVNSSNIPKYLDVAHVRSINNCTRKAWVSEPVAKEGLYNRNMDEETSTFIDMVGTHQRVQTGEEECRRFDYGLNHKWSSTMHTNVSYLCSQMLPVLKIIFVCTHNYEVTKGVYMVVGSNCHLSFGSGKG